MNSRSSPANRTSGPSPGDSPWFWASLFCAAALVALVLADSKFRDRQSQIERQFQARERSGRTVSAQGGPAPLSTPGRSMITLRPLLLVLGVLLLVTWSVWLWDRRRSIQRTEIVRDKASPT